MRIFAMVIACLAGPLLVGTGAQAQASGFAAPPTLTCPPDGGYAPPVYGVFARNSNDGPAPVEIASPCSPREVRDAAESVGMVRAQPGVALTFKGVTTAMFTAKGTFARDGGAPQAIERLDMHVHYGLPAARLMVLRRAGEPLDIRVFNDALAWTEITEGGVARPSPASRRELEILTKLTPFGALWSVIEAEGHTNVTRDRGQITLRGTSPYDGLDVSITLDAANRPQTVTVRDGASVWGATFADYRDDFEPPYLLLFPRRMTWTRDGRPFADLTVVAYKSNPYVVFPPPANVRAAGPAASTFK